MSEDISLLKRFEAVYRLRSFSRAAEELGMTHSAIVKSIRALESQWGVVLFDRTTRSVSATEAGRRLAAKVPELLALFQNARRATMAAQSQLRVISGPMIVDSMLGSALARFRQKFPDVPVHVDVMPAELACERIMSRQADLLLVHSAQIVALPVHGQLTVDTLISEPYRLLVRAGHPAMEEDGSTAALLKYDWVMAGVNMSYRTIAFQSPTLAKPLRDLLERNAFPKYHAFSQAACIDLARNSDVITPVSTSAARALEANGEFHSLPLPADALFTEFFSVAAVTLNGGEMSPALQSFIDGFRANQV